MRQEFKTVNSRLARRLSIYVILVSSFITIFTSGIQIYTEYDREVHNVLAGLEQIEKTHLSNIASRLWVLDIKELKSSLDSLLNLPSIEYVAVYDKQALLLQVGVSDEVIDEVERRYPLHYHYNQDDIQIGKLVVKASLENVYEHVIERAIIIVITNAVKTFIVAGLILLIFYRLVAKHLSRISEFAEQLNIDTLDSSFEFDRKKNPEKTPDELDLIKAALTKMQETLIDAVGEIQEREQDLKTTLNSIGDAVITTDEKGRVTRMNPIAEKLTGWSFLDAGGMLLTDIFPILDATTREPIENPVDKVLSTGETVYLSNHTTLISKDGTEYQIADSAAPIRNSTDSILGMVLVFNDVTEAYYLREQARAVQIELKSKERQQRIILNTMVDGVITIDEEGTIGSFNKTAESLFGYSYDEIIGKNVSSLMPEPYGSKHDGYLLEYLKTGNAKIIGFGRDVEGRHKNGEVFPMRLSVAELPMDEMGKRYFIGSCQDITNVKQQEQLLRRTQKMDALGKLTGGIAHDFNNMLGVMTGYADLLEGMLKDQPKLANYAHEIHHAGKRGAKLTKKLLSFSRSETSDTIKIDINKLLRGQQDMLQKTLTVRIKLRTNLADDVWPIWLDSSELEDAVLNISINAMHAMQDKSSGAQLTISTSNQTLGLLDSLMLGLKAGDYILLTIEDTGKGMDAATKEQIFDPFFTTKGEKGTGLGLSQVFGFVKRAGGVVNVYSEEDIGSRFVLYFPRYIDGNEDETTDSGECAIDLAGNETILVVDDESGLRDLAAEILTQQGYTVFCAADGNHALQILEKETIDLVFSDVIMPEMDGYELAAAVSDKYPTIKIQLASGFNDQPATNKINTNLYEGLLRKPYSAQMLLTKIRFQLDNDMSETSRKKASGKKKQIATLNWSDALSVGVTEIDEDYKQLVSLLNRSIDLVNNGAETGEIAATLEELYAYTQYHFQREENIMQECGYPFLIKHQNVHNMLIGKVQSYQKDCEKGTLTSDVLFDFLGGWLAEHILGMDKVAAAYCKEVKNKT